MVYLSARKRCPTCNETRTLKRQMTFQSCNLFCIYIFHFVPRFVVLFNLKSNFITSVQIRKRVKKYSVGTSLQNIECKNRALFPDKIAAKLKCPLLHPFCPTHAIIAIKQDFEWSLNGYISTRDSSLCIVLPVIALTQYVNLEKGQIYAGQMLQRSVKK